MVILESSGVFLLCLQGILTGAELLLQHPCSSIVPGQVPSGSGWLWLIADTEGVGRMMLQLPGTALLLSGMLCCRCFCCSLCCYSLFDAFEEWDPAGMVPEAGKGLVGVDFVARLQSCLALPGAELKAGAAVPSVLLLRGFPVPCGSSLPSCHSPRQVFHAQPGQYWGGVLARWNIDPGMNDWHF